MMTTFRPFDTEDLNADTVMVTARPVDWSAHRDEDADDQIVITEAYTVEIDEVEYSMIAREGSAFLILPNGMGGKAFERYDYHEEYWPYFIEMVESGEMSNEDGIDFNAWDAAFGEDPEVWGAEGPKMGYWYACNNGIDETSAAYFIADLPLCVVTIGDEVGFALTGGGQDHVWDVAEAYTRVGQLPPYEYARDLRAVSDRGTSDRDRAIVAASLRTFDVIRDRAVTAHAQLTERVAMWSN